MSAFLRRFVVCRALALLGATLVFLARTSDGVPRACAEVAPPPPVAAAGVDQRIGAALPLETHFRSSSGADVALGDLIANGRPALLVLAYNRCTMLCSLVLRRLTRLIPELGLAPGDDYSLVTLSIDPTDSVFEASRLQASLLDAAGLAGQTERWAFLVGERSAIDAVAGAVGFRYVWDPGTEQYAHAAVLITVSPRGEVSGYFDGLAPDPARVREALRGRPSALGVVREALSSCFRFDTAHTRYGQTLGWLLRGLGLAVSLGLCTLLWRLSRQHRRGEAGGRS
jgi:protein SCO1/2